MGTNRIAILSKGCMKLVDADTFFFSNHFMRGDSHSTQFTHLKHTI